MKRALSAVALLILALAGCGGGGGSSTSTPADNPTTIETATFSQLLAMTSPTDLEYQISIRSELLDYDPATQAPPISQVLRTEANYDDPDTMVKFVHMLVESYPNRCGLNTPDTSPSGLGRYPIHYVLGLQRQTKFDLLDYMIHYGASLDVKDKYGRTPVMYAAARGSQYLQAVLTYPQALDTVNETDNQGHTVLHQVRASSLPDKDQMEEPLLWSGAVDH